MYALFKQGTQDPPFEEAPKPGTFDFKVWKSMALEYLTTYIHIPCSAQDQKERMR